MNVLNLPSVSRAAPPAVPVVDAVPEIVVDIDPEVVPVAVLIPPLLEPVDAAAPPVEEAHAGRVEARVTPPLPTDMLGVHLYILGAPAAGGNPS